MRVRVREVDGKIIRATVGLRNAITCYQSLFQKDVSLDYFFTACLTECYKVKLFLVLKADELSKELSCAKESRKNFF